MDTDNSLISSQVGIQKLIIYIKMLISKSFDFHIFFSIYHES